MFRGFRSRPTSDPGGGSIADLLGLRAPEAEARGAGGPWWLVADTLEAAAPDLEMPPLVEAIPEAQSPWLVPPVPMYPLRNLQLYIDPIHREDLSLHGIGYVPSLAPVDLTRYPVQVRRLIERESAGYPSVVNDLGFLGLGQIGEARMKDLGFYTGDDNDEDNSWRGSFAGLPAIHDPIELLTNIGAQDEVLRREFEYLDNQIDSAGLGRYIDQDINGVHITRSGLRYGLHLIGNPQAVKDWLDHNVDSQDRFGAHVSTYIKLGSDVPEDEPWPENP
jgi:hypothetical protein